ncbi:hypothetical protein [Inconstantimicrobium mannanitabidum]|uniref:Uncharacterized protein n=1 Tax=Inconstantimicrobium mannanitabidum TaxID=1604901 RepID=A0ACB5RIG8_9CLOT|nr:hypothetical protein [Clostridium sp. TW13]GKX68923.1 hypothetical protein rsdtw13_41810 [Clostridium sp. TW13]
MRKKIIIFAIGLILVLACFFEYSNYQNKVLVDDGQTWMEGGGGELSSTSFPFEDNVKCVNLDIGTECGKFIKLENGKDSNDMKNIPNKGSVTIEIRDDESNVVKSFTIKGGEKLSKTVFLGKGSYDLKISARDGFEGKIESKVYAWKLI